MKKQGYPASYQPGLNLNTDYASGLYVVRDLKKKKTCTAMENNTADEDQ